MASQPEVATATTTAVEAPLAEAITTTTTTAAGEFHPVPVVPSPWACKGEFFWLFGFASSTAPYPGRAEFGTLEADSPIADPEKTGKFKGGQCNLMIVRYKDTPAGPYDEIIWSPGKFEVPPTGKVRQRITRIYVSTKDSVYNGRRNWNIPKYVAHFNFVRRENAGPTELPYSRIEISDPSHPDQPFFAMDLTPSSWLSRGTIPFNSAWIPINQDMAHPPLPQSPNWTKDALAGTEEWNQLPLLMKGKAGFFWGKGGLEGEKFGDNEGFPDVKPYSLGMWLRDFELDFPVGVFFKDKEN